jgi:hypothetical protein
MIDKKLDNVEYINSWRSMVTRDRTCTCEINFRIAVVKAEFGNKKGPFSPGNWALIYGRN